MVQKQRLMKGTGNEVKSMAKEFGDFQMEWCKCRLVEQDINLCELNTLLSYSADENAGFLPQRRRGGCLKHIPLRDFCLLFKILSQNNRFSPTQKDSSKKARKKRCALY